ncbi:MAG: hypothetical protein MZV70_36090 [Desulfobacterales bacterium]|nr:hypothetical protein [Desulfobacterales bacterium]
MNKTETFVGLIVADPTRTAEVAALADTHPIWTTANLLDLYNKALAVRATIIAQGF